MSNYTDNKSLITSKDNTPLISHKNKKDDDIFSVFSGDEGMSKDGDLSKPKKRSNAICKEQLHTEFNASTKPTNITPMCIDDFDINKGFSFSLSKGLTIV